MKTILSLFTFVAFTFECFSENIAINGQIELKAYFYKEQIFYVQIKEDRLNSISVMGPLESGIYHKPQTYWLEAQDANSNPLKSKLPTSFGQRQLKPITDPTLKDEPEWCQNISGDYSGSFLEITAKDLYEPHQKPSRVSKFPRTEAGPGYSGPGAALQFYRMVEIKEPNTSYSIRFDEYHLRRWFDFKTNKNYSVKVKLQPTKDSPIFESNPVIVKLSDKPQKKQLVPAESIKKLN